MSAADRLVQTLHLSDTCGVVLHHPSSIRYFTGGYTGQGIAVITGTRRVIITDGRYAPQANRQAPDFTVIESTMTVGPVQLLSRLCRRDDITTLRYEDDYLPVHQFRQLQDVLGDGVALLALYRTHQALRRVKEPEEIERIRQACAIADDALGRVLPSIHEGMTEAYLRSLLESKMLLLGAEEIAFPSVVAFGDDTALCHAPTTDRQLRQGDVILIDFGCRVGGYCSDTTRMLALGRPSQSVLDTYDAVRQAHDRSLQAIVPGALCRTVDLQARDCIRSSGCGGSFHHILGHGIGLDVHEEPKLSPVCHELILSGMVLTVEPGVYLPGQFGVRLEDTVLVTDTGHECLSRFPRELIIL